MPKFGTKNALFGSFWAGIFKKTIVIFEICTIGFIKNEFLTYTEIFGIGFAFSNSSGSVFSEDLSPSPGQLYRVCQIKEQYSKQVLH